MYFCETECNFVYLIIFNTLAKAVLNVKFKKNPFAKVVRKF